MTKENNIYERYINENGKKESESCHRIFHKYYCQTNPTPTYNELAKLSGYAPSTCHRWISEFDFLKRKEQIIAHQEEEKNNAIKKANGRIAGLLAEIEEIHVESHKAVIQDTRNRQDILSNLPTNDKTRIQLHKEEQEHNKSWNQLLEGLEKTNNFDDYMKEAAQDTTVINELLERVEDRRTNNSLNTTQKLEEEYKDEEY
ncbi:hypothetical protein [Methanosphaera sp.]|uniref:hypothetical protein n=1 Tax=Methanosphaera sp. TaxID=2666342 RepID=UPI0026007C47|nr:hypothetical protein [Methanosphaera sp.]